MSKPSSDDFNPLGTRFQKCRYFMMGTCKNGNKCHFMHFEPAAPKPQKKPVTSAVPVKPAVTSVVIPAVTRPVAKAAASSSEQQLQNEGEYFYGAPGSEPIVKPVGFQISFASMAANAGKAASQSDGLATSVTSESERKPSHSNTISSASAFVAAPSRKPCPFFAQGTCRFGSACRDSHSSTVATGIESPACPYCHQSYSDGKTHFDQCAPYLIVAEERRLSLDVCCDICYELVLSSGPDAKYTLYFISHFHFQWLIKLFRCFQVWYSRKLHARVLPAVHSFVASLKSSIAGVAVSAIHRGSARVPNLSRRVSLCHSQARSTCFNIHHFYHFNFMSV
jgi:hypothetical protein